MRVNCAVTGLPSATSFSPSWEKGVSIGARTGYPKRLRPAVSAASIPATWADVRRRHRSHPASHRAATPRELIWPRVLGNPGFRSPSRIAGPTLRQIQPPTQHRPSALVPRASSRQRDGLLSYLAFPSTGILLPPTRTLLRKT